MRFLYLLLFMIPIQSFAQESFFNDDPVVEVEGEDDFVVSEIESLKKGMAEIKSMLGAMKMPAPASTCECKCDCPSIDEIRQVVREELDRVTITVKSVLGVEKKVEVPLTKASQPKVMQLQPGETVIAIDGQPVTPFTYQSQTHNAPITQYTTPRYEMRVMSGTYGAVRQSTCRMVNGVKVCN